MLQDHDAGNAHIAVVHRHFGHICNSGNWHITGRFRPGVIRRELGARIWASRAGLAGPALDCERSVLGAQSWLLVIAER
ncbi:MAG TPA: hypothetical protein VN969_03705 [Streptosporangiaceae bacterium]|nr:hypothetical protein [Streptosporangiaceae bacterium]